MLQKMRQFSKSWVSNIFLGALTLSFVAWGIGDIFQGGSSSAVATVGGTAIEQVDFQRDYTNYLRSQSNQRGKQISAEEARKENLGPALLQQDISRAALDNVSHQLGLTASDAMVAAEIHGISEFNGLTGTFDRKTFQDKISRIGYTEQGFIELVRQDTTRTQLINAVESGFVIPAGYARALFAYSTEVRAAQYIVVDAKSLPPIAPPSDAVLEAYVKAHANEFSTPEYRDVTYAALGPNDVASAITVSEDQIKTAYDNNKDRFIIPEKRDLEQIIFPTQADAAAARAKIQSGTTFDQIAISRGEKPADTVLGELVAADLDPAQSGPVFALPEGGVSQPLKATTGGWALIHVAKIVPGKTTTLDQARPEIKKALALELAQAKLTDVANAYTDASSGGATLLQAAKKAGMNTGHVAAMDANGLTPDGSKAAVPDDPDFRTQVFKAEVGEEGDPQPAKSGAYYVVSVNGVIPPKVKPLSAVHDQALAAWTGEQQAILLQKKAAELTATANLNRSLDGVAKSIGATIQSSPALTHGTNNATFSSDLVTSLFEALPGETVYGPMGTSGSYIVARVSGIVHPLPPENDPNYIQGVRLISGGVASGITDSLSAAARDKQGVKINSKLLNNTIGGEGS